MKYYNPVKALLWLAAAFAVVIVAILLDSAATVALMLAGFFLGVLLGDSEAECRKWEDSLTRRRGDALDHLRDEFEGKAKH